mgnify:CR=1 FL=1
MYNAKAYSAGSATAPLAPITVQRRDPTGHDVEIEILFCGICHSDLHQVRNEWKEMTSFGVSGTGYETPKFRLSRDEPSVTDDGRSLAYQNASGSDRG